MILLVQFGGVDPRFVLLTYLGVASTGFFLAGLGLLISASVRLERFAVSSIVTLMMLWMNLPLLMITLMPRLLGQLPRWLATANDWLMASSPMGVLLHIAGAFPRPNFTEAMAWMVGLELAGGMVLTGLAIAWLRPASRRLEEKGSRAGTRGAVRAFPRLRPRPECGDDPILWKERYTSRTSLVVCFVGLLCGAALLVTLGAIVYYTALPAAQELLAHGYGSSGQEVARIEFNRAIIRPMTGVALVIYLIMLFAVIPESTELERARDTWSVLLSTPLSGREILSGKMTAAVLRFRFLAALLILLWFCGLVVGSVHPLGFLAAMVILFVSTRAGGALGVYASSASREKPSGVGWVTSFVIILTLGSPGFCLYFQAPAFLLLGGCSLPFMAMLSLATYAEVREAFLGSGNFDLFQAYGRSTGWEVKWVVAAYVSSVVGSSLVSIWLKRTAYEGFDAAVGRPHRPEPATSSQAVVIEPAVT
jgi:hypothetical protein